MGVASTTSSTAPTSYSAYTWTKIKGEQGSQGSPGQTGADGLSSYLHIKYSDDGTTFTANSGEDIGRYRGELVDNNATDSTTFSDYTWYDMALIVDEELNEIREELQVNITSIQQSQDEILMTALEDYTSKSEFETYQEQVWELLMLFKDSKEEFEKRVVVCMMMNYFINDQYIDKVIDVDQSPIGRTPRSNPATYVGVFTPIRELFADTPESKARGYKPGRFSFNVKGGRCESCYGDGIIQIEMHFLSDVYVPCEVCKGKRYNDETLDIRYKGKNIYEVLEMTVEEASAFFENVPRIAKKLQTLYDVGLGYIKLGQPATTLSGGEAQRVKLAKELSKSSTGQTLYILDEPTTGLHFDDIKKLLNVLNRLTDAGNSVVVIEHNLDVIKTADYIIDLGPEGGDGGGEIIATGTPEEIAESGTYTGDFLKEVLSENITAHAKELVEENASK